jgi:hypothetical protein
VTELNSIKVLDALNRLSTTRPDIFGANGHGFVLNPPLPETEVLDFE